MNDDARRLAVLMLAGAAALAIVLLATGRFLQMLR